MCLKSNWNKTFTNIVITFTKMARRKKTLFVVVASLLLFIRLTETMKIKEEKKHVSDSV